MVKAQVGGNQVMIVMEETQGSHQRLETATFSLGFSKLRLCLTQSLSPVYYLYSIRVAKVENGRDGFRLKVLKKVLNQRLGKNVHDN